MKKIKDIIIGFILGIIVIGSISVYAVEAVIESKEVSYDNTKSHGSYEDVQGSIDELYERSGIMKDKWVDPILNGADPVLGQDMIPVTIADDGAVKYANLYTKWYEYETKRWANAVILNSTGKEKNYKTGDKIDEQDIESYFVWVPRYKYKIWDLGNYTGPYTVSQLQDTTDAVNSDFSAKNFAGKEQLIDIVFETKTIPASTKQAINEYYTHPAFVNFDVNGLWVGKFETGKNANSIVVKPNVYSWRNEQVKTFWDALYNYKRVLDSHMMKNTEWGAVAYLSHSMYGIGTEANNNNNSDLKTGYSATTNLDQDSFSGDVGTTVDKTKPWNTSTGYLASTTGNITGIYDMSGGTHEYVAAYIQGHGQDSSGFTINELTTYSKYFDIYSSNSSITSYNNRILGDATGELGPFYCYYTNSKSRGNYSSWYSDVSDFVAPARSWFGRGSDLNDGKGGGIFVFWSYSGNIYQVGGVRLVLSIK